MSVGDISDTFMWWRKNAAWCPSMLWVIIPLISIVFHSTIYHSLSSVWWTYKVIHSHILDIQHWSYGSEFQFLFYLSGHYSCCSFFNMTVLYTYEFRKLLKACLEKQIIVSDCKEIFTSIVSAKCISTDGESQW